MATILALLLVAYMAVAYRYRGGWNFGLGDQPRWLELAAVSWPMGMVAWHAAAGFVMPIELTPPRVAPIPIDVGPMLAALLAWVVIMATMGLHSLGHGNAMNLGRRPYQGNERVEIWDRIVGECVPGMTRAQRYRRDALALALSGAVVFWPLAIIMGCLGRPGTAAMLLVAGAAKVVAYEIGWRLHDDDSRWRKGTEIGEVLFGAKLGAAVIAAL